MHLYKYTQVYVTQSLWALGWLEPKIESESTRDGWHKLAQALCTYFPSGKKCHFVLLSDSDCTPASTERALAPPQNHTVRLCASLWKLHQYLLRLRQLVLVAVCTHVLTGTFSCCNGIHWNWRGRLTSSDECSCLCTHKLTCVQHKLTLLIWQHTHFLVFCHQVTCTVHTGHSQDNICLPLVKHTHSHIYSGSSLRDRGLLAVLAQSMCEIGLFCKDLPWNAMFVWA